MIVTESFQHVFLFSPIFIHFYSNLEKNFILDELFDVFSGFGAHFFNGFSLVAKDDRFL